jgi:hypothetical protein
MRNKRHVILFSYKQNYTKYNGSSEEAMLQLYEVCKYVALMDKLASKEL